LLLPSNLAEGYLSVNEKTSAFASWTKIWIPYCDGSLHQGYTKDPVKYKDAELYFRGSALTRSHIKWIDAKYDLKGASKVLLTGMSAGGLAVNQWNNYVKAYVGDASKVYTVSDSGVFINFKAMGGDYVVEK
jgi:O-palmitoleoyl-L-serine hydrolase